MSSLPKNLKSTKTLDLPNQFRNYLKNQGVSPITVKNYLSDFNHFWSWLILTLKAKSVVFDEDNPQTIANQVSSQIINRYKSFLLKNKAPISTVNRRLSTLRQFGKFCLSQTWIKANPAEKVPNVSLSDLPSRQEDPQPVIQKEKILAEFKKDLGKEKVSPITIKNYLSDLRHFLAWIEVKM